MEDLVVVKHNTDCATIANPFFEHEAFHRVGTRPYFVDVPPEGMIVVSFKMVAASRIVAGWATENLLNLIKRHANLDAITGTFIDRGQSVNKEEAATEKDAADHQNCEANVAHGYCEIDLQASCLLTLI